MSMECAPHPWECGSASVAPILGRTTSNWWKWRADFTCGGKTAVIEEWRKLAVKRSIFPERLKTDEV